MRSAWRPRWRHARAWAFLGQGGRGGSAHTGNAADLFGDLVSDGDDGLFGVYLGLGGVQREGGPVGVVPATMVPVA